MSEEKNPTLDTSEYIPPPRRDFSHVEIPYYNKDGSTTLGKPKNSDAIVEAIRQLPKDEQGRPHGVLVDYILAREARDYNNRATVSSTQGESRYFATGAYRDTNINKFQYFGFFSPVVMQRYAEYMHKHRIQSDGNMRASDNWKKGIDIPTYWDSLVRHQIDLWLIMDGREDLARESIDDTLCAIMFNTMGILFERLRNKQENNA